MPLSLMYPDITIGGDPEIFFSRSEKIIGAERVVPAEGLTLPINPVGKIVLDGVQAEVNTAVYSCRQSLAYAIGVAFGALKTRLDEKHQDVRTIFRTLVEVDREELDQLSEKARILGCSPSRNFYNSEATIEVDPFTYRKRSAGGHVHMGFNWQRTSIYVGEQWTPSGIIHLDQDMDRQMLVPICDILMGLPSILIDRDPDAAERRQVYGRAGEYRLPPHGLEYRTLSNYWLHSYPIMSLVMGLAKIAVRVWYTGQVIEAAHRTGVKLLKTDNPADELLRSVDISAVARAINLNDREAALVQWNGLSEWWKKWTEGALTASTMAYGNLKGFEKFTSKPLEKWFPHDPLTHWATIPARGVGYGWESFRDDYINRGAPSEV